jgi:hypothetical protein
VDGRADESGTGDAAHDDRADDRLTQNPGPALVRQPEERDLAEMEAESIRDVRQIAKLHAERLPVASTWKPLWEELATSLADDESRLPLVGSGGSDDRR